MKSQGLDSQARGTCPISRATTPAPPSSSSSRKSSGSRPSSTSTPTSPTRTKQPSSRSCPRKTSAASAASIWKPPSASRRSRARAADKPSPDVDQLDFEFVLFASAVIDYDYIMGSSPASRSRTPGKQKMSREQLIGLIQSDAKFMDEREEITDYVAHAQGGRRPRAKRPSATATSGSRPRRTPQELAASPASTAWPPPPCKPSWTASSQRMIFDGEQLTDLMAPLGLGWKARTREGTRPDGRPRPAPEQARPRPRHLRAQRVRAVRRRTMTDDKPTRADAEAAVSGVSGRSRDGTKQLVG